jgi:hypothetical protein
LELNATQLQQCHDCGKEVNGNQIEFQTSSHDLDIPLDLTSIRNDPKFATQIEHSVLFTK